MGKGLKLDYGPDAGVRGERAVPSATKFTLQLIYMYAVKVLPLMGRVGSDWTDQSN